MLARAAALRAIGSYADVPDALRERGWFATSRFSTDVWHPSCKLADVDPTEVHFHDMRAHVATRATRAGSNVREVMDMLGDGSAAAALRAVGRLRPPPVDGRQGGRAAPTASGSSVGTAGVDFVAIRAASKQSMSDRTLIVIGIVTGAVMIAFITAVMVKVRPDVSLWDILWIDVLMTFIGVEATWRGLGFLRGRRLDDQDTQD